MAPSVPVAIRFESIGGLGAHLAAQLLAESLALRQGFNVSQFSSYGSEKKGTPVRSFIRVTKANQPIRVSSPVTEPDVLAVFHAALLARPSTLAGLRPAGALVVNAPAKTPPPLPRQRQAFLIDAMAIAVEEQTRINTAILGAVAQACPVIDAKLLAATLHEHFSKRSASMAEANVNTFWRGYREAVTRYAEDGAEVPPPETASAPQWGYATAPLGGAITDPGNTVLNDLSTSRQGFAPKLNLTKCIHCGICDLVCPDYCFVWEAKDTSKTVTPTAIEWEQQSVRLLGLDYQYCKGCLRCVDSCPSGALTKEREGAWVQSARVPLWQKETS